MCGAILEEAFEKVVRGQPIPLQADNSAGRLALSLW